jgi:hypothetical protein
MGHLQQSSEFNKRLPLDHDDVLRGHGYPIFALYRA